MNLNFLPTDQCTAIALLRMINDKKMVSNTIKENKDDSLLYVHVLASAGHDVHPSSPYSQLWWSFQCWKCTKKLCDNTNP